MAHIRLQAHAKVNLALALAPPEPPGSARPGWHRICTWMHSIDLADEVLIEPVTRPLGHAASTWSARWAPDAPRAGLADWPVERDLAWRALRAIEAHVERRLPTRIVLIKRIPTGAGLGGGSADAAAALLGIDRAWDLKLGPDTLRHLGATLGSDVPFFLDEQTPPRPAIVSGFGEAIERTPRARASLLLMLPDFGCPTGQVYRAFDAILDQEHPAPMRADAVRRLAGADLADGRELFNDLAAPACSVRPELARPRAAGADALGRPVHITGSGSAMFAVVDPADAEALADKLGRAVPGVIVRAARLV